MLRGEHASKLVCHESTREISTYQRHILAHSEENVGYRDDPLTAVGHFNAHYSYGIINTTVCCLCSSCSVAAVYAPLHGHEWSVSYLSEVCLLNWVK